VFGSGGARQIPDGFPKSEAEQQFVALLRKLGPLGEKHNVTITIEPLNRAECNFINSVGEAAALARACDHPRVRVLADFYHMMRDGQPPNDIAWAGALLRHVHIAEREKRTPPGVAGDDFRPYLAALKEIGYAGRISIECGWSDMAAQAADSVRYLRKQLEEVSC
jgi:sugar phosphate isomerase/epimerase